MLDKYKLLNMSSSENKDIIIIIIRCKLLRNKVIRTPSQIFENTKIKAKINSQLISLHSTVPLFPFEISSL